MEKENNFSAIHLTGALMMVLGHQFVLMGSSAPIFLGMGVHGLGVKIIFVMSGEKPLFAKLVKTNNSYGIYLDDILFVQHSDRETVIKLS